MLDLIWFICDLSIASIVITLFTATVLFFVISGYVRQNTTYTYWLKRKIKGPEPWPFVGNVSAMKNTMLPNRWANEYGKIYGFYILKEKFLSVADVESLKDILIRSFHKFSHQNFESYEPLESEMLTSVNGAQWKLDRSIMSPTFSSGKMKAMFHLMRDSYKSLDNELEKIAARGEDTDMKKVFTKLTTMIIARCAFATHVDAFKDENNELLKQLQKFSDLTVSGAIRALMALILPKLIAQYISIGFFDPPAMKYISKICKEILKQRRANPSLNNEYPDLLQLISESRTTKEGSNEEHGFSDTKIIANAILFFIAGFGTTSTLLFWATAALAMNPEIQERLYDEVKEAKEKSGQLDYETLQSIKYLDAFINETLRMYPPIIQVSRKCTEDHTLPNGLWVEKGTNIFIPIYFIHHDEANYPEPEKFDPERFMPENKDQIEPCAFLPFVQGPRNCIGMRFALLQAKMTLANLILKYQFKKSPRTPDKPAFDESSFFLDSKEIHIRVVKRK